MRETLLRILSRADWDSPGVNVYPYHEVAEFPPGVLDRLVKLGVLREIASATGVRCDECGENCWIEPVLHDSPKGPVAYYSCNRNEDVGGFFVEMDRFRLWECHFASLAGLVAKADSVRPDSAAQVMSLVANPEDVAAFAPASDDATSFPPNTSRTTSRRRLCG